MTSELHKIIDEGAALGADPRFVKELRSIADEAVAAQKQEDKRVAALPEITDERRAAIAARRAKYADRAAGRSTWKY